MFRFGFSAFALTFLLLVGAAIHCPDAQAELSRKQLREIESVFLPAYEQGETLTVLESLDRLMRQMSDEQMAEFDLMLEQQQISKSTHLMVQARMAMLNQDGHRRKLPKPSWQEISRTVAESDSQISAIKDTVDEHKALLEASDQEGTFEQFESLIWDAHVLEQKLESAIDLAKYMSAMIESNQYRAKNDLESDQRDLLSRDFEAVGNQLADTLAGVGERDLIARIRRLKHAGKVLEESDQLKDRYLAAWSIDFDGPLVLEELQQSIDTVNFQNNFLNDDQLAAEVTKTIQEGSTEAGELLLTKSRHLFTGLHWWTRGRFGMGPDAMGLLKNTNAITSDAALFPLMVPEKMPAAEPPKQEWYGGMPEYDRRHQFIWAWEYREVQQSLSKRTNQSSSSTYGSTQVTSETQLSRFY